MRIMKLFGGKAVAVALAFAMVPASAAISSNAPLIGAAIGVSEAQAQYHGRRYDGGGIRFGNRRHYSGGNYYRGGRNHYRGGRNYYRGSRYHRRGNSGGAAIAGAIVGLGIGAAIASANQPRYVERRYVAPRYAYAPEPWSRDWYRYCASKYRSFDARSGTFQPYHGPRQLCR